MKNFIRRLLGKSPQAEASASEPTSGDHPLTIEDGSDNAMRRQLVQVLLRDLLRRHGIAPHWVELQMLMVSSSSRGAGMYARLILRQWDDRLMNYAQALQNALLTEIARFEPQASDWLHGISWQLEMADSCPYTTLPDKPFWLEAATPVTPVTPVSPGSPVSPVLPVLPVFPPTQDVKPPAFATTVAASRHPKESDALEDLQRLFIIRDQALGQHLVSIAVGYEPTQPGPL